VPLPGLPYRILDIVSNQTPLSAVAPATRRHLAWLLLAAALVLTGSGLVSILRTAAFGWWIVGTILIAIALLLGLAGLGLRSSARRDEMGIAEAELDAQIDAQLAATGRVASCGGACSTRGGEPCGVADCAVKSLRHSEPRLSS
jgi:hypothetical protein